MIVERKIFTNSIHYYRSYLLSFLFYLIYSISHILIISLLPGYISKRLSKSVTTITYQEYEKNESPSSSLSRLLNGRKNFCSRTLLDALIVMSLCILLLVSTFKPVWCLSTEVGISNQDSQSPRKLY